MKLPPLAYDAVHKFVQDLAGDVLHPKQVDSLAHAVVGAIHADTASITAVPEHVRVTVLADRGFADTGLFWTLNEKMGFDYVIRFKAGTFVESSDGDARPAGDWVPSNSQAKRLDQPMMTRKRRRVPAVVCVKRAGMKEAWCLVTSLADSTAEEIVQLYSHRFDIEHTFRDQKDWRFGLALDHMTLGTPDRRDRMLLVLALATMFSVIVGAAGERIGLDRTLRANTETRKRTHSLLRQGHEYMAGVARAVIVMSGERSMCCGASYAQLIKSTRFFEGITEAAHSASLRQPCSPLLVIAAAPLTGLRPRIRSRKRRRARCLASQIRSFSD